MVVNCTDNWCFLFLFEKEGHKASLLKLATLCESRENRAFITMQRHSAPLPRPFDHLTGGTHAKDPLHSFKKAKKSNTLPEKTVLRMKHNLSRIPLCMRSPRVCNHTCKGCSRGLSPHWRHLPARPFVTCTSETGRMIQEWEAERSEQRCESQIGCEAAKNRAHMRGAAVRATGETHRGDLTN